MTESEDVSTLAPLALGVGRTGPELRAPGAHAPAPWQRPRRALSIPSAVHCGTRGLPGAPPGSQDHLLSLGSDLVPEVPQGERWVPSP